jgi:hypothetical protein
MILVKFPFTRKNIKNQKFRSSEKLVTIGLLVANAAFVLGDTSTRDLV